jgi:glycosyltransferase involved in cell wall biosynthesis
MNWPSTCAAVIPCLNEQQTIVPLVSAVRLHLPTVIVVDDGSTDQTAALAASAGALVLRHDTSRGKGAALQTGWRHARQQGFKWALSLDGDGQHSPDDIPAFFQCAQQNPVALVVGNRMTHSAQMPWLRRFVNRWMSRQLSKVTGTHLPDSQCGFRLMNLDLWSALPITATHFEIESEVLLAFLAAGHLVEFVPIRVIYKNEHSKIHPLRDTLRWLRWWSQSRARFALPPSNPATGPAIRK